MKAAVYEARGAARDVLRVIELPDPQPEPGEVRVRLHVSGVNPTDCKARALRPDRNDRLPWPQVPNQDGAGVVDAVGPGVDEGLLGTRVWVYHAAHGRPSGTAAQYACLPQERVVALPADAGFEQGAGLGVPYITAHRCLTAAGPHETGTVLVTGGAGAVGNAAIQLARWYGAGVLATVSSERKARLARDAGAHQALDYRAADITEQLQTAAAQGIHHVVDVAVANNLAAYLDVLAPHAFVASYASPPEPVVRLPLRRMRSANVTISFVLVYNSQRGCSSARSPTSPQPCKPARCGPCRRSASLWTTSPPPTKPLSATRWERCWCRSPSLASSPGWPVTRRCAR